MWLDDLGIACIEINYRLDPSGTTYDVASYESDPDSETTLEQVFGCSRSVYGIPRTS